VAGAAIGPIDVRDSCFTSTAAAAVMVGGIFVCNGTAPPYSLLAEWQPALHSGLRLRAVV